MVDKVEQEKGGISAKEPYFAIKYRRLKKRRGHKKLLLQSPE